MPLDFLHALYQSLAFILFAMLGMVAGAYAARVARWYADIVAEGGAVNAESLHRALGLALQRNALCLPTAVRRVAAFLGGAGFLCLLGLHGFIAYTVLAALAGVMVLMLALIDARSGYLPDALTLPLLWLGLAVAWAGYGVPLHDALAGAMLGYVFLWSMLHLFLAVRGPEALGRGDLKFLAALGAWLGWQALPTALLMACVAGLAHAMWRQKTLRPSGSSPFGPYLAAGAAGVFLAGSEVHSWFW